MSEKRDPRVYIADILDSIDLILHYTHNQTEKSLEQSQEVKDALLLRFAIIGEAASKLPDVFKNDYPHIPWQNISDMRNKIIHEYFGWNWYIIWKTITEDIPVLKQQLELVCMNLPQNIKAVIFDFDGLLIDSEPYWHKTTEAFFAKHHKPFHPKVHSHIMGMGLREIIEYFKSEFGFIGDTAKLVAERKELLYEFLLPDITLMEGAEELIHALHKQKLPLAIATSGHSQEKTKEILRKFGLEKYFSVLVSGDDVHKSKPAPDIYLKTAALLGVEPKDCLVFEDAPKGVEAGKAAGMIVYGFNKDEEIYNKLKEEDADRVFHSLFEIL